MRVSHFAMVMSHAGIDYCAVQQEILRTINLGVFQRFYWSLENQFLEIL